MTNFQSDRVLLGPCIVSFPQLFQASEMTGKYELDIIYEKGSKTHKLIQKLDKEAKAARWGNKLPSGLRGLVQDGDDRLNSEGDVLDGYEGMLFSKVRTSRPPRVTDIDNNAIEDPMEIKGGDTCVVLAHAWPYDNTKFHKKGVLLTLHGVRKIKDGEPLGGGSSVNAADEMAGYTADVGDMDF